MTSYTQNPCRKAEDSGPGPASLGKGLSSLDKDRPCARSCAKGLTDFPLLFSLQPILQMRKLRLRKVK